MSTSIDANKETIAVCAGFYFDEGALEKWMARNICGFDGPVSV